MEILICLCGVFIGVGLAGYMFIKPIEEKDKKINSQEVMIKNRDEAIERLTKQRDEARTDYDIELKRTELQDKQIGCIKAIIDQNNYGRDDLKLAKIKEMITDYFNL